VDLGLIRRAGIYLASGSASALVSFFLLPVLTRYLSPHDYGVVETFTTVSTCLTGVVLLGANAILAKEYFEVNADARSAMIGTAVTLVFIGAAVCAALVFGLDLLPGSIISTHLKVAQGVIGAAVVAAALNATVALYTTLLQVEKRASIYAIYVNSKSLAEIGGSLFLIIVCGWQWVGRIVGMLIGSGVYAVLAWIAFRRRGVRLNFQPGPIRHFMWLGLPMVVAHVSVWAYGMLDRLLINSLFSLDATGVYSVGYRFATVVNMVETAFSIAWMPFFFETLKEGTPAGKAKIVRFTYFYIGTLLVFAAAFGVASWWVLPWMVDVRFADARKFTLVLSLGFWFSGVWKMFNGYLIAKGRTKLYGYITAGSAIFHVVVTWFLLNRIGLMGAAVATLITFAFATIVTAWAAIRLYPMPWSSPRLTAPVNIL
jgi:O-antigen/teichoic acid export membrane protein